MRRPKALGALCLAAALVVAGAAVAQESHDVTVQDNSFAPATIEVVAGDTVAWTQTGSNPHTVTANDGSFDSHPICPPLCMGPGDRFEHTFPEVEAVGYYCKVHGGPDGSGMAGTVQVHAAGEPDPDPSPDPEPDPDPDPGQKPADRLAGEDRIVTAVAISEHGWSDGAQTAMLAFSHGFPDALAAGGLAAELAAPLLLTPTDDLPGPVGDELVRLGAQRVFILGGTAVISQRVAEQVEQLSTEPTVERLAGRDRYETGARILARMSPPDEVAAVSGTDFPDALATGALTAASGTAPALVLSDRIPEPTAEALDDLELDRAWVIGGTAVISDSVERDLAEYAETVERLAGADRWRTSQAVVAAALSHFTDEPRPLVIATGAGFADALAAGTFAARVQAPLLLVPGNRETLPEHLRVFLGDHRERFERLYTTGGTGAVSSGVESDVRAAISRS